MAYRVALQQSIHRTRFIPVLCLGFQGHDHLPGRQPLRGTFQGRRHARQGELVDSQLTHPGGQRRPLFERCPPLWRRRRRFPVFSGPETTHVYSNLSMPRVPPLCAAAFVVATWQSLCRSAAPPPPPPVFSCRYRELTNCGAR